MSTQSNSGVWPAEHGRFWAVARARSVGGWPGIVTLAIGDGCLVASAGIHLHLWLSSYRGIATIGPLFLAQCIGALVTAVLVVIVRRTWCAVLGTGVAVATIVGFLLAVSVGLFGFQDSWSAPFAVTALVVEATAAVAFAASVIGAAIRVVRGRAPHSLDL